MKSDVCKLPCGVIDIESLKKILYQTQKSGLFSALEKKELGLLRLLAEELVEMLPELLSFSGKNSLAVGIMSKIKLAVEFMLIDYEKNASQMMG